MKEITTIGLDLAKNVFQLHAIMKDGTVAVRRQLRRSKVLAFFERLPPCLVGMEAGAGSHHWARELMALGHDVAYSTASDRSFQRHPTACSTNIRPVGGIGLRQGLHG